MVGWQGGASLRTAASEVNLTEGSGAPVNTCVYLTLKREIFGESVVGALFVHLAETVSASSH